MGWQELGIAFRVMHGYASATTVYQAPQESQTSDKHWLVYYAGDWDPSGLHMSEVDLPQRLAEYGGQIELRRVALTLEDVREGGLPSFPLDSKRGNDERRGDSRAEWYGHYFGEACWELDALNPNILRDRLRRAVAAEIEPEAWARCARGEQAEQESLRLVLEQWQVRISGHASQYGKPAGER